MALRNKERTKQKIINALQKLIARRGYKGIDIATIAKKAKINRALIYRYFNGLPKLYKALAEQTAIWVPHEELQQECYTPDTPYHVVYRRVLFKVIDLLVGSPFTQETLKWELIESNSITELMHKVREQENYRILKGLDINPDAEETLDKAAYGVLLNGGLTYLALKMKNSPLYGGLDMRNPEHWDRVKAVVSEILELVDKKYNMGKTPPEPT